MVSQFGIGSPHKDEKKTFINIIVYCNCVIIFPSFFFFIFQFSDRFNLSLKLYCWLFFLLFVFPKIEWWHELLELLCVRSTCVKRIDWNPRFWWEVGSISYQINQKIRWFGIINFKKVCINILDSSFMENNNNQKKREKLNKVRNFQEIRNTKKNPWTITTATAKVWDTFQLIFILAKNKTIRNKKET